MTVSFDKSTRFISKLVELSVKGKIDWTIDPRGGFSAEVQGRKIRVFSLQRGPTTLNLGMSPMIWSRPSPVLEVLTDDDKVAYSIEDVAGLGDLLNSASNRSSRIDDFMDQVLAS